MPNRALNNLGLNTDWDLGEDGWKAGMDHNLLLLDTLAQPRVLTIGQNSPPSSPAAGDVHITGTSPTGAWSARPNAIAVYDDGAWTLVDPLEGWRAHNLADGRRYKFDGTSWLPTMPLNNLGATVDPAATDDADAGYSVLSTWFNTSSGEIWRCFDATVGAAVWKKTTLTLDELGSAATKNVGTGASDVPQNSDLGAAAYEHLPPLAAGDANKFLRAKSDESGNEYVALGLGGQGIPLSDTDDLNSIAAGGIYFWQSAAPVNAPASFCVMVVGSDSSGNPVQEIMRRSSNPEKWLRVKTSGAWYQVRDYHTGNILGTVSQSGGVPTGAIIERGSNANGNYVKLADGTLICSKTNTVAVFVNSSRLAFNWDFPAAFSDSNYASGVALVTANWDGTGTAGDDKQAHHHRVDSQTNLSARFSLISAAKFESTDEATIRMMAKGRWY